MKDDDDDVELDSCNFWILADRRNDDDDDDDDDEVDGAVPVVDLEEIEEAGESIQVPLSLALTWLLLLSLLEGVLVEIGRAGVSVEIKDEW